MGFSVVDTCRRLLLSTEDDNIRVWDGRGIVKRYEKVVVLRFHGRLLPQTQRSNINIRRHSSCLSVLFGRFLIDNEISSQYLYRDNCWWSFVRLRGLISQRVSRRRNRVSQFNVYSRVHVVLLFNEWTTSNKVDGAYDYMSTCACVFVRERWMITFGGKIAGRGERDKMHLGRVKERLVDFKTFVHSFVYPYESAL